MEPTEFKALDERRGFPRYSRSDIRVVILDHLDQVIDDRTMLSDISQGGARIATKAKILPGEGIKFRLHLPGGGIAFGHGKVRWVNDTGPAFERRCGVEFLDFGWGGFGRLQSALGGETVAAPEHSLFDSLLLVACAVVGFLIFRGTVAHPAFLDNTTPVMVIAGVALGIVLCMKR